MNPHFFTAPFYFAFIWFKVQGSRFKVEVAASPPFLVNGKGSLHVISGRSVFPFGPAFSLLHRCEQLRSCTHLELREQFIHMVADGAGRDGERFGNGLICFSLREKL